MSQGGEEDGEQRRAVIGMTDEEYEEYMDSILKEFMSSSSFEEDMGSILEEVEEGQAEKVEEKDLLAPLDTTQWRDTAVAKETRRIVEEEKQNRVAGFYKAAQAVQNAMEGQDLTSARRLLPTAEKEMEKIINLNTPWSRRVVPALEVRLAAVRELVREEEQERERERKKGERYYEDQLADQGWEWAKDQSLARGK